MMACGKLQSPISVSPSPELNHIKPEDVSVILQTKNYTSKNIPLLEFLNTILDNKVDSNIKEKALYFVLQCDNPVLKSEIIALNAVSMPKDIQEKMEDEQINKSLQGSKDNDGTKMENNISQKPKGKGRPRKDQKNFELPVGEDSSGPVSVSNVSTLSVRRSSRVPTKNSRFSGDFVDSSILTSKSSSGNTHLMTLALAAECHTPKSRKQNQKTSSRIHPDLPPKNISVTTNHSNSEIWNKNIDITMGTKITSDSQSEPDPNEIMIVKIEPQDEKEVNVKIPSSIIRRSLKTQLDLSVSSIESSHIKDECINFQASEQMPSAVSLNYYYYVLVNPKMNCPKSPLLIQGCRNEMNFKPALFNGKALENQQKVGINSKLICFCCYVCEKIFQTAKEREAHFNSAHCNLATSYIATSEKKTLSCHICYQKFPLKFMLDHHLNSKSCCINFNCLKCDTSFRAEDELLEHQKSVHGEKFCSICEGRFDEVSQSFICFCKFDNHRKKDTETGNSICNEIAPETNQSDNLRTSLLEPGDTIGGKVDGIASPTKMTEVKPFCEICDVTLCSLSELWSHKAEVHQDYFTADQKSMLVKRLQTIEKSVASMTNASGDPSPEEKNSNYFVVMKPKLFNSNLQLQTSLQSSKMVFTPCDQNAGDLANYVSMMNVDKTLVFSCNLCSLQFISASEYREHKSKEHKECFELVRDLGKFQCSFCSDTFPLQFMLDNHLKQHKVKKILPCTLCGMAFNKIQDRRQHWKKIHPGVGCPNCGKMYASINYLQKHISLNCQDHYPATKKFIAFRKKLHNDFHMEKTDKFPEKKILKCHLCAKLCSSVHSWRRHMADCHETDGFSKLSNTCIICNKVIYGYKALEKHLLEVHAEDSGLPIEEENSIIKHALECSKNKSVDFKVRSKSNIYQDEEGMFHCPDCPKIHSDLKALMTHMKTHINMQLECTICKKSYKNPILLKQHIMRHRTKAVYECNDCDKKFLTIEKLNKHKKVHHSKESFVCELCGMSFSLNDYLLKHKKCHTDERPHSCAVCGKSFRTKPELRVHVLIHTQQTPYVCEHCGRGFTQKGNWRIHLAQHTGLKPHQCKQCDVSFALPSHLKRHMLTHDQQINYKCIWCDKECTQRKHMQMHVRRVHKEDFSQFENQMKLENPMPIAPSQLKIYNRKISKPGSIRKQYRTRAKKCNSTLEDILDGVAKFECVDEMESDDIKPLIETSEETVASDICINTQDISSDALHVLVNENHKNYAVKHDIDSTLIEEDNSSNVEIIMGVNNEINIIINNAEGSLRSDLTLHDEIDESVTEFSDVSGPLPSSLQQAVNALVEDQKTEDGVGDDSSLPLDMETMISGDNYTIVYPPSS